MPDLIVEAGEAELAFADCATAAGSVRRAEFGRAAMLVMRPRSVLGLVRSRGPLALGLYLAAAEGRLVWRSSESFAVLERPAALRQPMHRAGVRLGFLRLLDRRWDLLLLAVPPVLALVAAVIVFRLTGAGLVAIWMSVAAMAYVTLFLAAGGLVQLNWVRRVMGARQRSDDEIAEDSLPGYHWWIPLLHHTAEHGGTQLVEMAAQRMHDLVRADIRGAAEHLGGESDSIDVRAVLVVLTGGVTTRSMRMVVETVMGRPFGPDAKVALRAPTGPVTGTREPIRDRGSFFFHYLVGSVVILTICAYLVSRWEAAACAATACVGRPATFGSALRWLASRLYFEDGGFTPATGQAFAIGWLTSLVGAVGVLVAATAIWLAITAQRAATKRAQDYVRAVVTKTRVLLLTATPTERDAVLAAISALTGALPQRSFEHINVIYELGIHGNVTIALVQCPRLGASGPGGSTLTAADVIRRWRPSYVLMIGTCYGLRDDNSPPQQLGDVLVSTSVYDLDHKEKYESSSGEELEEIRGDRVPAPSVMVARLRAASMDWPGGKVYFGLMLASGTLVASRQYRDTLRTNHRSAIGGEMEGHGLYAAAAEAGVPWILVKGISDWGFDRDIHYQPELAAGNAAAFVAHSLDIGAFDRR